VTYDLPVYVRAHHDGRCTAILIDRDLDLTAHAETREAALAELAACVARRIEDPDDRLGDRLLRPARRELRRVRVEVRVRRRSGRRVAVALAIGCALLRSDDGTALAVMPRLGLAIDLVGEEDVTAALEDEARGALAGVSDEEALALAPDADEALASVAVEAPPRARVHARRRPRREEPDESTLALVGADMTAGARRGTAAAAYGRDAEVQALLAALTAEPPVSVLLTGESGTGKSAIVAEAARRVALGLAPEAAGADRLRIVHLPASRILAGMKHLGDWQERVKTIVEEARERRAALFVDDLAELCTAGAEAHAPGGGIARFLAPYVARGEIALVAEATPERLRAVERLDAGLLPLFRRVHVHEMARDAAIEVLSRLAGSLTRPHGASLGPGALEAAVDVTMRFQPARRLPGKAVELLRRAAERKGARLDRHEVISAFAKETGLPEEVLRDDLALERSALVAGFLERVIEQPEAAGALADAILLAKTGLALPGKPIAVYLFAGPTGVGKTESAKSLAERLFGDPARLVRFDMSEFQDGLGAARLAGGPGLGEGELARRVRQEPFTVLLLDEIEKAHPLVMDLLLSVLGEGRLVDHDGRTADFRSAIVILTSNLGAEERDEIGFGAAGDDSARARAQAERYLRAAAGFFRPELLNRIDRIVPFRSLSRGAIERIARRELSEIVKREGLERRRITVTFEEGLVPALAAAGFHPRHGARPLKREIERRVLAPLARFLVRRGGREDLDIALRPDPEGGSEARLSVSERTPQSAPPRPLFEAPPEESPPPASGRLREGVALVRARLLDLLDASALRAAPSLEGTRADPAPETVRGALAATGAIEVAIDRGAQEGAALLDPATARALAARLAAVDRLAIRLEIEARRTFAARQSPTTIP